MDATLTDEEIASSYQPETAVAKEVPAATSSALTDEDIAASFKYDHSQSGLAAFGRGFKGALGSQIAGAAGMGLATFLLPEVTGVLALGRLAAIIGTGMGAGIGGSKAQEAITQHFENDEETKARISQLSDDEQNHAVETMLGHTAAAFPMFMPSPQLLGKTVTGLGKLATGATIDATEKAALMNIPIQYGLGATTVVANDLLTGNPVTFKDMVEAGTTQAFLFHNPTLFGRVLGLGHGTPATKDAAGIKQADPSVTTRTDDITAKADSLFPTPDALDEQHSAVLQSLAELTKKIEAAPDDQKPQLQAMHDQLMQREAELSQQKEAVKPSEEAAPTIVPVLKVGDEMIAGTSGQTHKDIFDQELLKTNDTERHDALIEAFSNDRTHLFQDANGEVLGRNEAGAMADQNGLRDESLKGTPLQSEHLKPSLVNENKTVSNEELIAQRQAELQTERESLTGQQGLEGSAMLARNQRVKEIDAMIANPKLMPESSEPTRAPESIGQTKLPQDLGKAAVDHSRERLRRVVETLLPDNPHEADTPEHAAHEKANSDYRNAVMDAFEPYHNALAAEDIEFAKAPPSTKKTINSYAVPTGKKGEIGIEIPSREEFERQNASRVKQGRTEEALGDKAKFAEEEVIHAMDYAEIRKQWIAKGKKGNFDAFAQKIMEDRGALFRRSIHGLAAKIKAVYSPRAAINDFEHGAEFTRMLIQRARTGKITEDLEAQRQAALGSSLGKRMYQTLVDSIRQIKEVMARYLGGDMPAGLKKVYDNLNDALDRHGIIKPEPEPPLSEYMPPESIKTPVEPRVDQTPENVPAPQATPVTNAEEGMPKPDAQEQAARQALVNEKQAETENRRQEAERTRIAKAAKKDYLAAIEKAQSGKKADIVEAAKAHLRMRQPQSFEDVNAAHEAFKASGLKLSKREYQKAYEGMNPKKARKSENLVNDTPAGLDPNDLEGKPLAPNLMRRQGAALEQFANERNLTAEEIIHNDKLFEQFRNEFNSENPRHTHEELARMARSDYDNLPEKEQRALKDEAARQLSAVKVQTNGNGELIAPNGQKSNLSTNQWKQVRTPFFRQWAGDWLNDPANSTKVLDANGEPMVVYHGTGSVFDTFAKGDIGYHFGTIAQAHDRIIANFSTYDELSNETVSDEHPVNLIPVFLNIRNPIRIPDIGMWKSPSAWRAEMEHNPKWQSQSGFTEEQYNKISSIVNSQIPTDKYRFTNEIKSTLKEMGYDGVIYKNTGESNLSEVLEKFPAPRGNVSTVASKAYADSYIAFEPEQIKSSIGNTGVFSDSAAISRKAPALVNENVDIAEEQATKFAKQLFSPAREFTSKAEDRVSRAALELGDLTPQEINYLSSPRDVAKLEGANAASEMGLLNAAEHLFRDPTLTQLKFASEWAGAERAGFYQFVQSGLKKMLTQYQRGENNLSNDAYEEVINQKTALDYQFQNIGKESGQFVDALRSVEDSFDGDMAKENFFNGIVAKFKDKYGKGGKVLDYISNAVKGIYQKHIDGAISRPEMVGALRYIQDQLIKNPKAVKAIKETIANQSEKLKTIVGRVASRAASGFESEDTPEFVQRAADRIIKLISFGIAKPEGAPTPESIMYQALSNVSRDVAESTGLLDKPKGNAQVTHEQRLAAILKNPEIFDRFVSHLEDQVVSKWGVGENPEFKQSVRDFVTKFRDGSWKEGMVNKIIADKLRGLDTTLTKVARDTYGKGQDALAKVKASVAEGLTKEGITDPEIHARIANDLETHFNAAAETARQKWINGPEPRFDKVTGKLLVNEKTGPSNPVTATLRELGLSVADVAKMHYSVRDRISRDMAKRFVNKLGLPNTEEMPFAKNLANLMQTRLAEMVHDKIERSIKDILEPKKSKLPKEATTALDKIVQFANMGALDEKDVYEALHVKLGLPKYSDDVAQEIIRRGDEIGAMPEGVARSEAMFDLSKYMASQKGISLADMAMSGMYASILSGPTTLLGTNPISQGLNTLGYVYAESVLNPRKAPEMLTAFFHGMTKGGWTELQRSMKTGVSFMKLEQGQEYSPLEYVDPKLNPKFAFFANNIGAKYITRILEGADAFFARAVQESAYVARGGKAMDSSTWNAAIAQAEGEFSDPHGSDRVAVKVRANELIEQSRTMDEDGVQQWRDTTIDALDASFHGKPRRWLGTLADILGKWLQDNTQFKFIMPFTKIVASVFNAQLDWTPYPLIFDSIKEGGLAGKAIKYLVNEKNLSGLSRQEQRLLVQSVTGMVGMATIYTLFQKYADDKNPFMAVYGDGPSNRDERAAMLERGWKPNTIKVGHKYFNYQTLPTALAMAMVGRVEDRRRDGKVGNWADIGLAMASSPLSELTRRSFLSGFTDITTAMTAPDPEKAFGNMIARTVTSFVEPNLFKQIDKAWNPTIQEANNAYGQLIREIPVVRSRVLNDKLNNFGHSITRKGGITGRFITTEETNDPVSNFIAENRLKPSGFGHETKLGDKVMTNEERYAYIKEAGPKIEAEIARRIPDLQRMTKEEMQQTIDDISGDIKRKTRYKMLSERTSR